MKWKFWQKKEKRGLMDGISMAVKYNGLSSYKKPMYLSAVYACVECISNAVAQMPLEPFAVDENGYKRPLYNHPTYKLLCKEPNEKMSRFTFLKIMVTSMLLRGNAFAYIQRDRNGNAISLMYIDSGKVTIVTDDPQMSLYYDVAGTGVIVPRDMIHFINMSYDGIRGHSTIEYATNTLTLSADSESHAAGFFRGGANTSGILKVHSTLSENQKKEIKSAWAQAFNPDMGTSNGVAVLPGNMDYQQITISPADAQLLETREYNVVDICRFFGVSPVKIGDLSKSSYSTVEATQLAFLTDTLRPIIEKIELELERKLFREDEKFRIDVRFDTSSLLRADKTAEAQQMNTYYYMGVLSVNEIRKRLDLQPIDGGDAHFVQVNLQKLENAGEASS